MGGNFWNRVVSSADIRGRAIAISATIRQRDVVYTATHLETEEDGAFGPFRTIVVCKEAVRCGQNENSTSLGGWLDRQATDESRTALASGDYIQAYLIALNAVALNLEFERRENPSTERKAEIERSMSAINVIKHDLEDVVVVERQFQPPGNSAAVGLLTLARVAV